MNKQNLTRGAILALIAAVVSNSAAADEKAHDFYFQQSQKALLWSNPKRSYSINGWKLCSNVNRQLQYNW